MGTILEQQLVQKLPVYEIDVGDQGVQEGGFVQIPIRRVVSLFNHFPNQSLQIHYLLERFHQSVFVQGCQHFIPPDNSPVRF